MILGVGHHFVDQSLLKAKGAWNSPAGQFFRKWTTGFLNNPGVHRGYSGAHRSNSDQIKGIIQEIEKDSGLPLEKWTRTQVEEAIEAVRGAQGHVKAFLEQIAEENPTARTVMADVTATLDGVMGITIEISLPLMVSPSLMRIGPDQFCNSCTMGPED